ncbi:MAG: hypothetical protein WD738_05980 [Pirellulales bacterium]
MCELFSVPLVTNACPRAARFGFALLAGLFLAFASAKLATAESTATELVLLPAMSDGYDPFESDLPETRTPARKAFDEPWLIAPIDERSYLIRPLQVIPQQASFQTQPAETSGDASQVDLSKDPCAGMAGKPLGELGISIALPTGQLPNDPATACWSQLNQSAGALAGRRGDRCWATYVYNWEATCLCHRPLYFEQINLERHGYGCPDCLQAGVSAAHFFATVPALPYCMAVECPCECVYTLGHYRPGSCPPWRHHWPPCSPLAAAAGGGVWTGMVFLIP